MYIRSMQRRGLFWPALLGLLVGIGLGLLAGYGVWPAEYDHITPELLAAGHQDDYATMIAVAYAAPHGPDAGNLDLARARLGRLGPAAEGALRRAAAAEGLAGEAAATLLSDLQTQPSK